MSPMPQANRYNPSAGRRILLTCVLAWTCVAGLAQAQQKKHWLYNSRMPAGEIGRLQLAHRPQLVGVTQTVHLRVPAKAKVALAEGQGFPLSQEGGALVSLQVGATYRLRVSDIPQQWGDVYPTVELIDRMHPPKGKELRYPIPIEITAADLRLALSGKYVTRVIYVEDPHRALPVRDLPEQRYVDALAHEDPLHVAVAVGRPVAILRMGSVAPGSAGPTDGFLFGSPPFQRHPLPQAQPYRPSPHPQPPVVTPPAIEPAPAVPAEPEQEEASPNDRPVEDTIVPDPVEDTPLDDPFEVPEDEGSPFADDLE